MGNMNIGLVARSQTRADDHGTEADGDHDVARGVLERQLSYCVCWVGFVVGGICGMVLQFFAQNRYHELGCVASTRDHITTFAWGGFGINVCFICYAQLMCLYNSEPIVRSWLCFFIFLFGLIRLCATGWGAYICGSKSDVEGFLNYLFIFFGLLRFWGNAFVLFKGVFQHKDDLHLATFFLMVVVVLIELFCEEMFAGHADSFLAFNYFNIKLGVEVYEVARDAHWYTLPFWDVLQFAFYLSCRMTIQIYYFATYHRGGSATLEMVYGVCSACEFIVLMRLLN